MLKVKWNKNTRTISLTSFWCFYCYFEHISLLFVVFLLLNLNQQVVAGYKVFDWVLSSPLSYKGKKCFIVWLNTKKFGFNIGLHQANLKKWLVCGPRMAKTFNIHATVNWLFIQAFYTVLKETAVKRLFQK